MITASMTYQEIADTIRRDYENELSSGFKSCFGMRDKYEHIAKQKGQPGKALLLGTKEKETKNKNKYVFLFLILGKEQFKKSGIQTMVRLEYHMSDGVHVAIIDPNNHNNITFYTPHFYERFRERYLENVNIPMKVVRDIFCRWDVISFYMPLSSPKYEANILGINEFGVGLGSRILYNECNDIIEYRTYIRFDMLKGDEIGITEKEIQKLGKAKEDFLKLGYLKPHDEYRKLDYINS